MTMPRTAVKPAKAAPEIPTTSQGQPTELTGLARMLLRLHRQRNAIRLVTDSANDENPCPPQTSEPGA